jgi:hypothetical protein
MTLKETFTSSVGKKLVMAFTGLFLILFLIVHVSLNACIWANDGGEMFNRAAHFMGANIVPKQKQKKHWLCSKLQRGQQMVQQKHGNIRHVAVVVFDSSLI